MKNIGIKQLHQGSLNDFFLMYNFIVPNFQREFSWTIDDWKDFFDDIQMTRTNEREHFFGFMTFKKENFKVLSIIEGQQRLTSSIILICVIRDILKDIGKEDISNIIDNQYIYSSSTISLNKTQDRTPKLKLSGRNEEPFTNYILPLKKPFVLFEIFKKTKYKRLPKTNKLLLECYKYFYNNICDQTKGLTNDILANEVIEIQNALLNNFMIISYEVADNLTAYNVFQTLNDRGLDLALSDLLKIYLLEKVGEEKANETKIKWDQIIDNLNTANINIFLRNYWLSSKGVVKEKKLLNEIELEINTRVKISNFLNTLKEESEGYDSILNPLTYYGNEQFEIIELLTDLKDLSIGQSLPLLLSGKRILNDNSFKDLLIVVTNYLFRYLTIGEKENKYIEKLFSDLAIDLRERKIKSVNEIKEKLKKSEYVPDDLFKQLIIVKDFKSNSVPKYILKKIEKHLHGDHEVFSKTISLEHIIPKSPDEKWRSYLKQTKIIADDWIYKIGNMTLLLGKINSKSKTDLFKDKQAKSFNTSTLVINDKLKRIKKLDLRSLENRQKWIADNAVKIWKI